MSAKYRSSWNIFFFQCSSTFRYIHMNFLHETWPKHCGICVSYKLMCLLSRKTKLYKGKKMRLDEMNERIKSWLYSSYQSMKANNTYAIQQEDRKCYIIIISISHIHNFPFFLVYFFLHNLHVFILLFIFKYYFI